MLGSQEDLLIRQTVQTEQGVHAVVVITPQSTSLCLSLQQLQTLCPDLHTTVLLVLHGKNDTSREVNKRTIIGTTRQEHSFHLRCANDMGTQPWDGTKETDDCWRHENALEPEDCSVTESQTHTHTHALSELKTKAHRVLLPNGAFQPLKHKSNLYRLAETHQTATVMRICIQTNESSSCISAYVCIQCMYTSVCVCVRVRVSACVCV